MRWADAWDYTSPGCGESIARWCAQYFAIGRLPAWNDSGLLESTGAVVERREVRRSTGSRRQGSRRLQLVIRSQGIYGALADEHAGSHGVAGGHARHDRSICDAKVVDAIHPE